MPCRLQVLLDQAGELAVERGQHLVEHLDQRHLEPGVDQVLRRLQADEAAADHHRAPRRLDELDAGVVVHAGQELGAALDPLADRARVRHGAHLEDAGQVDARAAAGAPRRAPGESTSLS